MAEKFEIKVLKWRTHAMTKEMWAGALRPTQESDRMGVFLRGAPDGGADAPVEALESLALAHLTPALLQIVMEVLTNASDHHRDMLRFGRPGDRVTRIDVAFSGESGTFVVENDGLGVAVSHHPGGSSHVGHPVRIPEVVFAIPLAGANMDKPEDSVKGGTNGLGAKLANVHSDRFRIETVGVDTLVAELVEENPDDPENPTVHKAGAQVLRGYVQNFGRRAGQRNEPKLYRLGSPEAAKALSAAEPHTRVSFRPAYEALHHTGDNSLAQIAGTLEAWTRWQVYLLSAYVGPKVRVSFNGVPCGISSATHLAEFYARAVGASDTAQLFPFEMKARTQPQKANPWQVVAAILPGKPVRLGVVNGVYCCHGTHVNYMRKLIGDKAADRMQKLASARRGAKPPSVTDACRHLSLFFVAPIPGAAWNAQNKRNLQIPVQLLKPYTIPVMKLNQIGQALAEYSAALSELGTKRKTRKKAGKVDKYFPARRAGGGRSADCTLLAAEGDSAIQLLQAGLTLGKENPGGPTFEFYGIFSLGGVIMNALRNVKAVTGPNGRRCLIRSKTLKNNAVIAALVEILGLSYGNTYETEEELGTLNYGALVVSTDQDLDGTGKILPLVLLFFNTFWPELIRRGFVRHYITPVTRAYPKKKGGEPHEFYYENDFKRWLAGVDGSLFAVSYYKGLASHSSKEVVGMFRRFNETVSRFVYDPAAAKTFVDFYDKDTAARKAILSTPVVWATPAAAEAARVAHRTNCTDLMQQDAKAYKLDAISRNIPHFADGLMVARRKILTGAIRYFRQSNAKKKVFQLGGFVADKMMYHHGSDPLNKGIVRLAQRFPGANNYPYLAGLGMFGTRHFGGKDAGSPRYINVRLAKPYVFAMFPPQDTWLLPRRFEDVVKLVRAYAAGHELVSRVAEAAEAHPECASLAALVRARHAAKADVVALREAFPMATSLRGYGAHLPPAERARLLRRRVTKKAGKPYLASYGAYELLKAGRRDVIRVTELPIGLSTEAFKTALDKREAGAKTKAAGAKKAAALPLIQSYVNESTTLGVDIRIVLVAGGLARLEAAHAGADDPVAEYLDLHESLSPFLNLYTSEGTVREFDGDYRMALFAWAPLRRDLYRRRYERAAILLRLRVRLEEETLRYIDDVAAGASSVARLRDEAAASADLTGRRHPALDAGLLSEPKYVPAAELERLVLEGPGASLAYLLNLRERDLVLAARNRRAEKAARLREELEQAEEYLAEKPFAGSSVWLREVDAVLAAIAKGETCGWWSEE